mmetsp:Transcript_12719/g.22655  ORF Transcript_12719/g.22655 Transcript_12719/m.22655 type:complete len:797 (+) Transcript_12719:2-2392(+)
MTKSNSRNKRVGSTGEQVKDLEQQIRRTGVRYWLCGGGRLSKAVIVAPLLLLLALAGAAVGVDFALLRRADRDLGSAFAVTVEDTSEAVKQALDIDLRYTYNMYAVERENVSYSDFVSFVQPYVEDEDTFFNGVSWNPFVFNQQERAKYEAWGRAVNGGNFTFNTVGENGLEEVGNASFHCVVLMIEPVAGNEGAVGFDIGSSPVRLETINKVRDTMEEAVTARITLVQTGEYGALLLTPVIIDGVVSSLVVGVLGYTRLIGVALASTAEEIRIDIYDTSNPTPESQFLFSTQTYTMGEEPTQEEMLAQDFKFSYTEIIPFADREFLVRIASQGPEDMYANTWSVLWIQLAISVFVVLVVAFRGIQAEKVRELVVLREALAAKLRAMKDRAEADSRAKSRFVSNMTHEIRTPMAGILGLVDFLRQTELNAMQAQFLQNLTTCGEALLDLIDDILDFSKIEAGRLALTEGPLRLGRLVGEALVLNKVAADKKKVVLESSVQEGLFDHYQGDALRLRQVLINLMGNSVKFTKQGSVTLSVKEYYDAETRVPNDHKLLLFSVRDTGIGIAKAFLGSLFKAFEQQDSKTTRKYGGSGLGLAITKSLVELMGGRIWVESEVGQGSTFFFTALLKMDLEAAKKGPGSAREGGPGSGRAPAAGTAATAEWAARRDAVLVVEDNLVHQKILRNMLERHLPGASVDQAYNGRQALEMAGARAYAMVLMDLQMPGMDGYQAAKAIRLSNGPSAKARIIAVSATAETEARAMCLEAGMDDFFMKPLTMVGLKKALHTHLIKASSKKK